MQNSSAQTAARSVDWALAACVAPARAFADGSATGADAAWEIRRRAWTDSVATDLRS